MERIANPPKSDERVSTAITRLVMDKFIYLSNFRLISVALRNPLGAPLTAAVRHSRPYNNMRHAFETWARYIPDAPPCCNAADHLGAGSDVGEK